MSWLDSLDEVKKRDWANAPVDEQRAKAREVVDVCAYGGCLAAVVPVPLMDLAILLPVHSAMVMTIGHVFGRSITQTEAKKIVLELGAVAGLAFVGAAAISAIKRLLLPGVGGLLSIPATFALTWGVGRATIAYFENPNLARDELKRVFEEAMKEGKNVFSPEAFEQFRKRVKEEPAPDNEQPPEDEKTKPPVYAPKPEAEAPKPAPEAPKPSAPSSKPGKRTL